MLDQRLGLDSEKSDKLDQKKNDSDKSCTEARHRERLAVQDSAAARAAGVLLQPAGLRMGGNLRRLCVGYAEASENPSSTSMSDAVPRVDSVASDSSSDDSPLCVSSVHSQA